MCLFKSTQQDAPVSAHNFLFSSLTDARQGGKSSEGGAHVEGGTPVKSEPSSPTYTHKVETKEGEMRFLRPCALVTMTVRGFIYHSVPVVLNDSTFSAPFFSSVSQAEHGSSPNIEIMFVLFDTEAWWSAYSVPVDMGNLFLCAHGTAPSPERLGVRKHSIGATDEAGCLGKQGPTWKASAHARGRPKRGAYIRVCPHMQANCCLCVPDC